MVDPEAPPTSGTSLPTETWIQVICQLKNDHIILKTLSLVCSAFRSETERLLFRSVHLSSDKFDGEQRPRTRDFLLNISSSNRLSHHIRVFHADLSESNSRVLAVDFEALITGALCSMRNLYHLRVIMGERIERLMLADLAHNVPFQLERFETDLGLDDGFAEFVRAQPSLVDIRWLSKEESPSNTTIFTPQDLPHLKKLRVEDGSSATMFLPHCPVNHLFFKPFQYSKIGVMPSVRALMIEEFRIDRNLLPAFAQIFPSLEYIDLYMDEMCIDQYILNGLKGFRYLKKVKIWETEDLLCEEEALLALSSEFMATNSVSCVEAAFRQEAGSVSIRRVRRSTESPSLHKELIDLAAFDEYNEEVWRWTGVPE